jgi:glycosyltransferase involved in cell wall biosynthesis
MSSIQHSAARTASPAPRVSVIIPAYLSAPLISQTLDSVFAQAFSDYEVIVINDGSPDTPDLEVALRPYMARIHYLTQTNKGPSAARNRGIQHARGEFLAFLDSDDLWLPDFLGAQVSFLESHPQVDVSIADALLFGEAEETPWRMLKEGCPNILAFPQLLRRQGGQIPSASVARRQRAIDVGMFDEQLRYAEDLEFFVRICFPDRAVGYLGQALVKYRKHPDSLTSDPRNRRWRIGETEALRRLGKKLDLNEGQRRDLEEEIAAADGALALDDAYQHISDHEFERAGQCLRSANTHYRDFRIGIAAFCLGAFPRLTGHLLHGRWKRRPGRQI